MEHRDLIKAQIEQLGRALGKLLADFLGLKSNDSIEQGIEVTNSQLKSEFDIDIAELVTLAKEELKVYLVERKIGAGHFEILAEYIKELGENKVSSDRNKAAIYLTTSLHLLDLEDELSKSMSFERLNLKSKIESMLQQCI